MTPMNSSDCTVGIDVSKDTLDICLFQPAAKKPVVQWKVKNNGQFNSLFKKLAEYNPQFIVLEPSGGYELFIWQHLIEAGFPVRRESALKLYYHGRSKGQLGKTDKMDARMIADYAYQYADKLRPDTLLERDRETLKLLIQRRDGLLKQWTQDNNRLLHPFTGKMLTDSLQRHLAFLKAEIQSLDETIEAHVKQSKTLAEVFPKMTALPGVGRITAIKLLAYLPELGRPDFNRKQIASLVGIAPHPRESGRWRGRCQISGGRAEIRCALYMSALTASRHFPKLAAFYEKLVTKGKPKKVALVAVMHKLLRILHAILKKDEPLVLEPAT